MRGLVEVAVLALLSGLALVAATGDGALAQFAHHPFAVGANEGAVGHQSAFGAWALSQESRFYLALTHAIRATKTSATGAFSLAALSFAYGVFHAVGPGHGKAVITSYLVANEVALRRGFVIALLAALLQGLAATALVGIAVFVFNATAPRLTAAAEAVELFSYVCIVGLGLFLCWRKGSALVATVIGHRAMVPLAFAAAPGSGTYAYSSGRFVADSGTSPHRGDAACGCGRSHMPDPGSFGARLDLKAAAITVLTAGARPCSGAILVLVFSLAQGMFIVGVASTFAMALGTALTTGALATTAVFAKDLALRWSGRSSPGSIVIGRLVEFGAAACVLLFGVALLLAFVGGVHAGA